MVSENAHQEILNLHAGKNSKDFPEVGGKKKYYEEGREKWEENIVKERSPRSVSNIFLPRKNENK